MTEQVPSETFDIGEIAIVVAAMYHHERIGREVEIVGALDWRQASNDGKLYYCYRVRHQDGRILLSEPHELRKRRPPEWPSQEQLRKRVSWKDCVWHPAGVNS